VSHTHRPHWIDLAFERKFSALVNLFGPSGLSSLMNAGDDSGGHIAEPESKKEEVRSLFLSWWKRGKPQ
jgi:hypothetical protein